MILGTARRGDDVSTRETSIPSSIYIKAYLLGRTIEKEPLSLFPFIFLPPGEEKYAQSRWD